MIDSRKHYLRATLAATAAALACAAPLTAPHASAAPDPANLGEVPPRTSISFVHSPTGASVGTPNEHESRPGLSLVKLYIADFVYDNGSDSDRAAAFRMLQTSDDAIALSLYTAYPQSIAATAGKYGLADTHAASHWGNSTTSTYDVTRFLEARKRDHGLQDPILVALATASPIAADGYAQNYGTALLPGVVGTKWGWSDDRTSLHASASFGGDFSVAAHTYGPAAQLTADVLGAFPDGYFELPAATPAQQAINDAGRAAHAAVDSAAEAVAAVPGSSDAADSGAAAAHAGIDNAVAQISALTSGSGF